MTMCPQLLILLHPFLVMHAKIKPLKGIGSRRLIDAGRAFELALKSLLDFLVE